MISLCKLIIFHRNSRIISQKPFSLRDHPAAWTNPPSSPSPASSPSAPVPATPYFSSLQWPTSNAANKFPSHTPYQSKQALTNIISLAGRSPRCSFGARRPLLLASESGLTLWGLGLIIFGWVWIGRGFDSCCCGSLWILCGRGLGRLRIRRLRCRICCGICEVSSSLGYGTFPCSIFMTFIDIFI